MLSLPAARAAEVAKERGASGRVARGARRAEGEKRMVGIFGGGWWVGGEVGCGGCGMG